MPRGKKSSGVQQEKGLRNQPTVGDEGGRILPSSSSCENERWETKKIRRKKKEIKKRTVCNMARAGETIKKQTPPHRTLYGLGRGNNLLVRGNKKGETKKYREAGAGLPGKRYYKQGIISWVKEQPGKQEGESLLQVPEGGKRTTKTAARRRAGP